MGLTWVWIQIENLLLIGLLLLLGLTLQQSRGSILATPLSHINVNVSTQS